MPKNRCQVIDSRCQKIDRSKTQDVRYQIVDYRVEIIKNQKCQIKTERSISPGLFATEVQRHRDEPIKIMSHEIHTLKVYQIEC
jgi:hypothetical protein